MVNRAMLLKTISMLDRVMVRKVGGKQSRIIQADKETGKTINTYYTAKEAGEATGISYKAIRQCVSNPKRKTTSGFIWRKEFVND